jgi:hypothetical protein
LAGGFVGRSNGGDIDFPRGPKTMPRLIEIVLFLAPLLSFAAWRLLFPSPTPPLWLVFCLAGFVALMLLALVWSRQLDAGDAAEAYIPAQLQNGHVVPAQRAHPPP